MQIHLANCNLSRPPLQHLPVDESPRAEEMKSVNIVQCSHTMYAKSTKERRNAFCQYPLHTQYNTIDSRNCWPTQCKPTIEKQNGERSPKCKLPKTTQQLCNTVLLQSSRRSSHAHAKSPETLIILSIDGGYDLFKSCKIIHLRQSSCLTNIACLFFTGLGGAVADR